MIHHTVDSILERFNVTVHEVQRANALHASKKNAEINYGDNHWTKQSSEQMVRWKAAIADGKMKKKRR